MEVSSSKSQSASKVYSSGKKFKPDDSAIFAVQPYTLNLDESEASSSDENSEKEDEESVEKVVDPIKSNGSTFRQSDLIKPSPAAPKPIESDANTLKPIDSKFVQVNRKREVIASRNKLPIITEEFQIMEEIKANPVVIICGETGSGKTTQIPQFLYEHGFAYEKQIVITQPRRVAAISMSKRVAYEMNLGEDQVSYQIRYEGNTTERTQIKFVTDGVLMKEMQKDFLLSKYSIVIVDEAHERSIYSDILIGLISRIIKLREKRGDPLRLIIMSATLRITDFTDNRKLFKIPPPVIKIESRQYPVSVHFSKYTPQDYIKEAFKKVCKIHKEYPDGGILVFVTGRKEVNLLMTKLKRAFPQKALQDLNSDGGGVSTSTQSQTENVNEKKEDDNEEDDDIEEKFLQRKKFHAPSNKKKMSCKTKKSTSKADKEKRLDDLMPVIDLDSIGRTEVKEIDALDSDSDYVGSDEEPDNFEGEQMFKEPLFCLPLYSMLPEREQAKVFEPAPAGCRLCVIATNVAETSLTIPNIKYVVDTGKIKNKVFDMCTGISAHVIEWCAKSSADQRAGRSGRTAPGHCFRLYSSAVYNHDFKEFPQAEILKKPLDDLILQLKSMHIEVIRNFPFPTVPDLTNIEASEKRLMLMGALQHRFDSGTSRRSSESNAFHLVISALGKLITNFPVSPRYGKMLAVALQQGLIDHMITIVACLTVQEMFLYYTPDVKADSKLADQSDLGEPLTEQPTESALETKWKQINAMRRQWLGSGQQLYLGDVSLMLKAVQMCESNCNRADYCEQLGIRHKSMVEIHKLRRQLIHEISDSFGGFPVNSDLQAVATPTQDECKKLRQLMLLGFADRVARVLPPSECTSSDNSKALRNAYKCIELESPVFLNEKSVLKEHRPEWVVYQEIYEHKKMYMRTVVAIEEEWVAIYAGNMCKFSKPLESPPPRYDPAADQVKCHVVPTFGPFSWVLKKTDVEYPECNEKYKIFARAFLDGQVFASLQPYSSEYISSPSILSKEWSKIHDHANAILSALIEKRITSKRALKKEFDARPSCK